ncbi:MAG TPA: DegV family protein, partial [Pseudoxanthomonas sp.]|nr:DegV family protein [Pseudoxanthomonas sp.]
VGLIGAALGSALDIKPVLRGWRGATEPVAKLKGFESTVEKLFDFTIARIRAGLMTPTVCLSYGGELDELRFLPGYNRLHNECKEHGIEIYECVMGLTGMVNVGKGAVVVGFAAAPHEFKV